MSNNNYIIKELQPEDNEQIAKVIREVLIEFGVPKVGTAYEDSTLDRMFETYNESKSSYFIIVLDGQILGGAGIMKLRKSTKNICELQKMYFAPKARGKGLGSQMIEKCLNRARAFGYEKCYLETLPYMLGARKLYKKTGFTSLEERIGNTGHFSCNMWMIKTL